MARAADPPISDAVTIGRPSALYRVALVVVAIVAGCVAIQSAVARFFESVAPDVTLRISPSDAGALSVKSTSSFAAGVRDRAQMTLARKLATQALARDLTRDDALFVMAATTSGANAEQKAGALIEQAERLSRRNLAAQLWLIEDAVRRQDVAGALHQFDLALRTSPSAGGVLFPILRGALEDPALVGPIARTLDRAPWRDSFLQYAVSLNRPTVRLASVMARQTKLGSFQGIDLKAALVSQLATAKNFDAAALLALGRKASLVQDADFADTGGYPPFTWQLTDASGLAARRLQDGATPQLQVQADDGAAGVAATQLIRAEPGSYILVAATATDTPGLSGRLRCAADGRDLAEMEIGPREAMAVTIPSDCPYQQLELFASANGEGEREWRVTRLDMLPAAQVSKQ